MPGYSLEHASRLLEWPSIIKRLCELAASEPGRERCAALPLLDDAKAIRTALTEVSEARELLERGVNMQFNSVVELGTIEKRARVGSVLDGQDLLIVGGLLRTARLTRRLLESEIDRLPHLAERAALLPAEVALEKEIFARIERDGRVSDNASKELGQLRDRYRVVHSQIHSTLDTILKDPKYEDALQENLFTLRSGRFVLPVKVDHRGKVEGIVHDISQTGQSLYIEPREVTGLNNHLRTAELEIEREIYRILLELTYKVGEIIDDLNHAVMVLADLDVVFAKARYSMQIQGRPVEVTTSGAIELQRARHPLLAEKLDEVIPNDIVLDDIRTLVVSGPNTGGKTVYIKTIGLCALLLRAGMHLPCAHDGKMPLFKRIFAVIGDEQSIEQNLSSFSSHVLNLKNIVDELVPNSLVLIDEIGEGTDPNQGIALAKAFIEHLHEHNARTIVTTHFAELTAMAQLRDGYANAAMAFDGETMTPTYHLLSGSPGRSSAFAIAERLGLAPAIVQRAREFATGSDSQLDKVINELEGQRQRLETQMRKADEARKEAEHVTQKQREILDDLRARKAKIAAEEREQIEGEMAAARAAIKKIIRELQDAPAFKAAEEAREQLDRVKKKVEQVIPAQPVDPVPEFLDEIRDWDSLSANAMVYLRSMKQDAMVLEKPDAKGRVKLQVREKRMTLPAEECFLRRQPLEKPAERSAIVPIAIEPVERTEGIELDLRGQTADEALASTEEFLDNAARARLTQVYIIHGHGTGVLKRTIRDYLKSCPYCRSWRPGERGEGSDGVTVVVLDL